MPITLVINDTKDNKDEDNGLPLTEAVSQAYKIDEFT